MMEQMEFENCIEKMKKRKEEGDLKTAAKIADRVPWDEVNDINILMFVSDIYEEIKDYKDARAILEYAYEIAPVKNRLYYALSRINAKCKDISEATSFYIDFCDAFPEDNRKQLLKYEILKAKGAPLDQQKRVLEEYTMEEKDEEVLYELVVLADKMELKDELIDYVKYIIDFFGVKKNGYGKKALLIKKKWTELSEIEENLLKNATINNNSIDDEGLVYDKTSKLYDEDIYGDVNVPVEKVERIVNTEEQKKFEEILASNEEDLNEDSVDNVVKVNYVPNEDSYREDERNSMAFLNEEKVTDKEKLKVMIKKLKEEEEITDSIFNVYRNSSFERLRRLKEMKLDETKLHMIIEARSREEGVDIAIKELNYIHDVLGEKVSVAKASAYNMNEKSFAYYAEKIVNKDLIIENAGKLKNEIIDELEEYIINKKGKTIFALVDIINNFDKVASERPSFIQRFDVYSVLSERPQETLTVTKDEVDDYKNEMPEKSEFTNEKFIVNKKEETKDSLAQPRALQKSFDKIVFHNATDNVQQSKVEKTVNVTPMRQMTMPQKSQQIVSPQQTAGDIETFVAYCREYAKTIDCSLTSKSIEILYERAEEMKDQKIALTKENAGALIEEAADRAEKPRLFSKPKYDEDGCLIISEEHLNF